MVVLFCAAALAGEPAGPPVVVGVTVSGLREVSEEKVRGLISAEVGKPLAPATMDRDFLALWRYGATEERPPRFIDVAIAPVPVEGGVVLEYRLRERPRVQKVQWRFTPEKEHALKPRHFSEAAGLAGKLYDESAIAGAVEAIRSTYLDNGYVGTDVRWSVEPAEGDNAGYPRQVVITFAIREGERFVVAGFFFEGLSALSTRELLGLVGKDPYFKAVVVAERERAGWWEYRHEIARYFETYLRYQGFLDAVVEPAGLLPVGPDAAKYRLLLKVSEGPRYRLGSIEIKGNQTVATAELLDIIGGAGFAFYSPLVAQQMAALIRNRYGRDGRVFTAAGVEPEFVEDYTVNVAITVREDNVRKVRLIEPRGNSITKDHVIRREFALKPGDIYDQRLVVRSRENIYNLDLFDRIEPRPFAAGADQVDIMFDLKEGEHKRGSLAGAVSYAGSIGLVGQLSLKLNNFDIADARGKFLGGGQYVGIDGAWGSEYDQLSLTFREPYFLGKPVAFTLEAYDTTSTYARDYAEGREGLNLSFTRRKSLDPYQRRLLTLGLSLQRYDAIISNIDGSVPPGSPIWDDEGRWTHAVVKLTFGYDCVDSPLVSTRGYLTNLYAEVHGKVLGGEKEFVKYGLRADSFVPLAPQLPREKQPVLALKLRAQHILPFGDTSSIPTYERLYAGGEWTEWAVRGYVTRSLSPRYPEPDGDPVGGNFGLAGSVEVRFPLVPRTMAGVVFFDAGNVWAEPADFDAGDIRTSAGFGVRFLPNPALPFPIALYWAWPLNAGPYDDTTSRFIFALGILY